MNKRKVIMALALVLIVIVGAGVLIYLERNDKNDVKTNMYSCETSQDCVADSCCHATGCVNSLNAPLCGGKMCTLECRAGTLDCGEKVCSCINKRCEVVDSSK